MPIGTTDDDQAEDPLDGGLSQAEDSTIAKTLDRLSYSVAFCGAEEGFKAIDAGGQAANCPRPTRRGAGVPLAALDGGSLSFDTFERFSAGVPGAITQKLDLESRTLCSVGLID